MVDEHGQPEYAYNRKMREDRTCDELLGLCKGVLADHRLHESEVEFLCNWIARNHDYLSAWPGAVLVRRIGAMLEDNIIDDEEKEELVALLKEISGSSGRHIMDFNEPTTLPLCTPPPLVTFPEKSFCLTGRFYYGSRSKCENTVMMLGGAVQPGITKSLDYLVIGSVGSRDWKHTSFGRKIEKAVQLRDEENRPIRIISESHWAKHLMDL